MKQAVVIIGAGAGGLAFALTLSQFGIKPIVIDNNFERSRITKVITMQPRTLEISDSFGLLKEFLSTCPSSNIFVEIDPCSELYARLQKSPFFLVISPDRYVFEIYASEDLHVMLNHMNTILWHEENYEDIRNQSIPSNKYFFNFDLLYDDSSKKNRRSL